MTTKGKIFIGIGVVAVVGLVVMLFKGKGATSMGSGGAQQWKMGYLSSRDSSSVPVHLLGRPIAGTINKGDTVKITKTSFDGTYPVDSVWLDKNGNVGALYLTIQGYTPTSNSDRTFEGIGVITKL